MPAGVAQNPADTNTASNAITMTYDSGAPTVTLSSTSASTTSTSPIPIAVTFSESITGFTLADVTVTNGTAGTLSGSGASFSFNITPTAAGPVTAVVGASAVTDSAGNSNAVSSTLSRIYSTGSPNVTLTTTASSPTNQSSFAMTATFTESVTGFISSDVSVSNGTVNGFSGSGNAYTFNVTPTADGAVTVTVPAGVAQNPADTNTASNTISIAYDTAAPTAAISSSAASTTATSPIPFTVTFNEAVTGFTNADVGLTNGTLSGFTSVSNTTYTFNVSPAAAGAVNISIAASVANDGAGNANSAASAFSRIYSTGSPSVNLSTTAPSTTNQSTLAMTVSFSDAVTGFVAGDISVTNGTVSNFAGSGASYTFDVTPTSNGSVSTTIPVSIAQTAAADPNLASNTVTVVYDSSSPSVTLTSSASNPTNGSPIQITATFNESVTGFVAARSQASVRASPMLRLAFHIRVPLWRGPRSAGARIFLGSWGMARRLTVLHRCKLLQWRLV